MHLAAVACGSAFVCPRTTCTLGHCGRRSGAAALTVGVSHNLVRADEGENRGWSEGQADVGGFLSKLWEDGASRMGEELGGEAEGCCGRAVVEGGGARPCWWLQGCRLLG